MQAYTVQKSSYGKPAKEEEPTHLSVIDFIEKNISIFLESYIQGDVEKGLNSNFVLCMNSLITNELFIFHHEDPEDAASGISPTVDIGLYSRKRGTGKQRFFAIEAKRLSDKLGDRKKEYTVGRFKNKVYLNSGAIERFKKEIHGNKLIHAGILGYIQVDDFHSWEQKINTWIDEEICIPTSKDLIWEAHDKLVESNITSELAKYTSKHTCISKKEITITHLWVNLT